MDLLTAGRLGRPRRRDCGWIPSCDVSVCCIALSCSALKCALLSANWKLLHTFWLDKRNACKIKMSCNNKKMNTINTAPTRVWLCAVKTSLECPGEKQMISDGHPGFFLFEKPESNRLTPPGPKQESFSYEHTIDWQLDEGWLFINFNASLQIKPLSGIKA